MIKGVCGSQGNGLNHSEVNEISQLQVMEWITVNPIAHIEVVHATKGAPQADLLILF